MGEILVEVSSGRLEDKPKCWVLIKKEDLSDDKLMKEIDEFLNDDGRDDLDNDEHLKQLLILSDKADMIHHPSAKKRRQQMIKVEIQKLRRKISIDKIEK